MEKGSTQRLRSRMRIPANPAVANPARASAVDERPCFPSPSVTLAARRARAAHVLDALRVHIPTPETELAYRTPFELVVAVVLSAQCTDARVNLVTPALFEAYPTAHAMAGAEPDDVLRFIRSVSYPNNKARHLVGLARRLVAVHGGEVPNDRAALEALPGVGRKTASVVLAVAFDENALAVDTHVFRVSHRLGLVPDAADTPRKVEDGLSKVLAPDDWNEAHHLLILHGRYTCLARTPRCERCPLTDVCPFFAALAALPPPIAGLDAKRGRYYSPSSDRYFDTPGTKLDRQGVEQLTDPSTGAMTVYDAKTGRSLRRVRDWRVG